LIVSTNAPNYMEQYAARVYGYLIAPSNGFYRFFMASDDASQLWINTNSANSASPTGRVLVASVSGANLGYSNATVVSPFIQMNAGQRYYVEALLKEGGGGDYVAVAVREAGNITIPVYPGDYVPATFFGLPETLRLNPTPSLTPSFAENTVGATLGTVIGVPAYIQWYSNNVVIAGATNATLNLVSPLPLSYNGQNIQVIATNAFSGAISNQFALTVTTDATPPTLLSVTRDGTFTNLVLTFSEVVNSNSAITLANYVLSDGVNTISLAGARALVNGSNVVLSLPVTGALDPSTIYYLTNNNIIDRAATPNAIAANTVGTSGAWALTPGFLALDFYANVASGALSTLTNDVRFVNNTPDIRATLASLDFHTTNLPIAGLANYGAKIYAWFMPPSNGVYRFYLRQDDVLQLYMNTNGPAPSGRAQLMNITGCCGSYGGNSAAGTVPLSLTNGTAYYLEVLFGQGTGQDYVHGTWRGFPDAATAAAALPPDSPGSATPGWSASGFYVGDEIAAGAQFGVYGDPSGATVNITLHPTGTNIAAGQSATLAATATVNANAPMPYVFFQWQADNGTGTYTNAGPGAPFRSDYAMLGNRSNYTANYFYSTTNRVVARVPGGASATSASAAVVVPTGFGPASVGSLDGRTILLVFNKPVDPTTATDSANYLVSGNPVSLNPTVNPDGRTVLITPDVPVSGSFTVEVPSGSIVLDSTLTVGYVGTITGAVIGVDFVNDVGTSPGVTDPVLRGSAVSSTMNGVDVVAGGSDIFGTADGMFSVARQITGNFDVRVRVAMLTNSARGLPDANAKAAINARITTNGNSRMVNVNVAPPALPGWPVAGANTAQFLARDAVGGSAINTGNALTPAWPPTATPWIRLVRVGTVFYGYRSFDGVNWTLINSRDTSTNGGAYPDTLFVGLATSSHNNTTNNPAGASVTALYRDLYFPPSASILTQPSPNYVVGVGSMVSWTVVASNPPNAGPLTYQWRVNGTNIMGANTATLTLLDVCNTNNGAYTVIVANDGGGMVSVPVTLTVTNGPATGGSEALAALQNTSTNYSSALLLGNNTDPEGRALSIVGVSGIAPVTFYTDFETGVPANSTLFGNAHLVSSVGVTNSAALALTDAAGNQNGAWIVNDLVPGRSVGGFVANFKIRLGDNSVPPADGMALSVADDLPNGTASEEGAGTGFSLCLDNFDNGNLEAPAFDIKWRGAIIAHVPINAVQSPNWLPVTLIMRADGTMDLFLTNTPILLNLQTPWTPILGARFGFYARTGGLLATHWLDEVSLTVFTPETSLAPNGSFSYVSDFSWNLPPGATVFGNAYWTNQTGSANSPCVHLTDGAGGQAGSLVLDEITPGKPVRSFTATFNLRIGNGSGEPADGMSLNLASDLPNGTSGGAEEGVGTGLAICIDNYRANGAANNSAMRLKWRGVQFAVQQINHLEQHQFHPGRHHAHSRRHDHRHRQRHQRLQQHYDAVSAAPWPFRLLRRTGGEFQTHWIDDLSITVPDYGYVTLSGTSVLYAPRAITAVWTPSIISSAMARAASPWIRPRSLFSTSLLRPSALAPPTWWY
jgi:hypothetical protein